MSQAKNSTRQWSSTTKRWKRINEYPRKYELRPLVEQPELLRRWYVVTSRPLTIRIGPPYTLWEPEAREFWDRSDFEPDWMPYL